MLNLKIYIYYMFGALTEGMWSLNQPPNRYICCFWPNWKHKLCSKHNWCIYLWDQHTFDIKNKCFIFDFLYNNKCSLFLTDFFSSLVFISSVFTANKSKTCSALFFAYIPCSCFLGNSSYIFVLFLKKIQLAFVIILSDRLTNNYIISWLEYKSIICRLITITRCMVKQTLPWLFWLDLNWSQDIHF